MEPHKGGTVSVKYEKSHYNTYNIKCESFGSNYVCQHRCLCYYQSQLASSTTSIFFSPINVDTQNKNKQGEAAIHTGNLLGIYGYDYSISNPIAKYEILAGINTTQGVTASNLALFRVKKTWRSIHPHWKPMSYDYIYQQQPNNKI